jgi:hypothetical protein
MRHAVAPAPGRYTEADARRFALSARSSTGRATVRTQFERPCRVIDAS